MSTFSICLIGIVLSIDSLAVSITAGACVNNIRRSQAIRVAAIMAMFQGLMPFIGWLIGSSFKSIVEEFDHWIAFVLLAALGGKLIYDGCLKKEEEDNNNVDINNYLLIIGMALATSIDALILGIGFGLMEVNIYLAVIIIALITFLFSGSGLYLGKKIGEKINKSIEVFGGLVLISLGVKILIEHLYLF
ncbi:MAG: manganese efflux pump MntP family protein [Carboxylicivirga sp.]|jgi:putative Mn2+ efflux pump MntP|nr:manganese efflux pump MntP family protein [Carboxylicivirga sp.]